jgi:archaellum biogenesis protein FlaJ (TadC family)
MKQISSVGGKLTPEDVLPYIGNLLIVMAWGLLLAVITALAVLGVIALSRTLPRLKVDGGEFSLTRKEKLRAVFTASGFIAMLLVGTIFLVSHVTGTPVLSMLLPR